VCKSDQETALVALNQSLLATQNPNLQAIQNRSLQANLQATLNLNLEATLNLNLEATLNPQANQEEHLEIGRVSTERTSLLRYSVHFFCLQ
jgi:hypothetical protein